MGQDSKNQRLARVGQVREVRGQVHTVAGYGKFALRITSRIAGDNLSACDPNLLIGRAAIAFDDTVHGIAASIK